MSYRYATVALNELLIVTRTGEHGFRTCAERVGSPSLRVLFAAIADRHQSAATELRELIDRIGGDAGSRCLLPGAARRGWVNLPVALTLNDDGALVDECGRGEDHALEVYRNALDDHLPEFVRHVVLRQFEELMNDRQLIRVLAGEPGAGGTVIASYGDHAQQ